VTKILLTGATSFIGKRFLEDVLALTDWAVYSLERRYQPNQDRVQRFYHDLRAEVPVQIVNQIQDADYLVHLAADVSGIKSLADPVLTVTTNVVGTYHTLELARKLNLKKFVYVSTGEAVGSAPFPMYLAEDAPLRPSNPYAASKAAAEALVNSYQVSFNLPTMIIRVMNVFGPGQQLIRFVPTVLKNLLEKAIIKCHVGPDGRCGSRSWLHVEKVSETFLRLLENGKLGEIYHVVGPERSNLDIILGLAKALNVSFCAKNVVPGPSHDLRYALKDTKLGLDFSTDFDQTLVDTARWYDAHREALV
jgi:dTDP-glucose 4,6-dehydratase